MHQYPGPPPPPIFAVFFISAAACGLIYFLLTDFWVGFWMLLFVTMGVWKDIAKQIKKLFAKNDKSDPTSK